MKCSLCEREAVDRCFACGQLFCEDHGKKNCVLCQNSIVEGDPSPRRVSASRQQSTDAAAWWRPQQAEEYAPPACHICRGLTRAKCTECGRYYCADHAGRNFQCRACVKAFDPSFIIVGGFLFFFLILVLLGSFLTSR